MAFGKKKHRFLKVVIKFLVAVMLVGVLIFAGYRIYSIKTKEIELVYKQQIQALELEAYALNKAGFVAKESIREGTILNENLVEQVVILSELSQSELIDKDDFGKVMRISLNAGVPIMKSMVFEEIIQDDDREQELSMLLLSSQLLEAKYVDVRICFPNGEDYIVLSKKKIHDIALEQNTVWLWLDEQEILTINSAIIDAYLHRGTKLYTVSYIEPNIQEEAVVTYPVNNVVLAIMQNNPNILEDASISLTAEARELLDERLLAMNLEDTELIESGVNSEGEIREESVSQQVAEGEVVAGNQGNEITVTKDEQEINGAEPKINSAETVVQEEVKEDEPYY